MKKGWKTLFGAVFAVVIPVSGFGCTPGEEEEKQPPEEPLGAYEYAAPETIGLEEAFDSTIVRIGENIALLAGEYRLEFVKGEDGYALAVVNTAGLSSDTSPATAASIVSQNSAPAEVSVTTNKTLTKVKTASGGYDEMLGRKAGGVVGYKKLHFESGTAFSLYDEFVSADGGFTVTRTLRCDTAAEDAGYYTGFRLPAAKAEKSFTSCEYVLPANLYGSSEKLSANTADTGFAVSQTKAPAGYTLLRVLSSGDVLSLGVLDSECSTLPTDSGGYGKSRDFKYCSLGIERAGTPAVSLAYPCQEAGVNTMTHKYAEVAEDNDLQISFRIFAGREETISAALTEATRSHFAAKEFPDCEIDSERIYRYSVEDLNGVLWSQGEKAILPFAAYVESGNSQKWGYLAESGFIGMQISLGYEMLRYGIGYGHTESKNNGLKILDMWAELAPYPGSSSGVFSGYINTNGAVRTSAPTLRLLTDGAEGMLDAVRLAESSLKKYDISAWKALVTGYAEFLVQKQNADGSWYRAYDYDGNLLVAGNRFGIGIDANTLADSKLNTQMPVRFLCRMYEYTGDSRYLDAAGRAGAYVEENVIGEFQYCGGTLDTKGVVDKESGIFCEYAMNALYATTGESKWLRLAEQAAAYAMIWTYTTDFPVNNGSGIAAGKPTAAGYTAGMSVISSAGYGADSFMRYLYYDLFRLYLWTEDGTWLSAAKLLQNCSVRMMDIDGEFGYAYRSFMIEATDVSSFQFVTAEGTGVWLPWITNANIEPMTNMMQTFGCFTVEEALEKYSREELLFLAGEWGAGGGSYGGIQK